jgi:hypothetical protein
MSEGWAHQSFGRTLSRKSEDLGEKSLRSVAVSRIYKNRCRVLWGEYSTVPGHATATRGR